MGEGPMLGFTSATWCGWRRKQASRLCRWRSSTASGHEHERKHIAPIRALC